VIDFETDHVARVAVLHGIGTVFCAGADLSAIANADTNRYVYISLSSSHIHRIEEECNNRNIKIDYIVNKFVPHF
jgi:enoyl-CoA hydratase/carnithine racemase